MFCPNFIVGVAMEDATAVFLVVSGTYAICLHWNIKMNGVSVSPLALEQGRR